MVKGCGELVDGSVSGGVAKLYDNINAIFKPNDSCANAIANKIKENLATIDSTSDA